MPPHLHLLGGAYLPGKGDGPTSEDAEVGRRTRAGIPARAEVSFSRGRPRAGRGAQKMIVARSVPLDTRSGRRMTGSVLAPQGLTPTAEAFGGIVVLGYDQGVTSNLKVLI